jgi:SsrA-binding protein
MSEKTVAVNRKAFHDYEVLQRVEAGLVLTGSEIKSIRDGRAHVREAYARPEGGELWLVNAHISPYPAAHRFNHEPTRRRKLLLHRVQIRELGRAIDERGLTLVPLRLYLKRGLAKVELGLVRGRRQYDKRQAIARREAKRQMERALRHRE